MRVKMFEKTNRWALIGALVFALLAMACASTQQMPEYIGNAESAVNQARAVNADEVAPRDFEMAQEKLQDAKDWVILENHREARYLAQQAAIDAKVAEAKAETVETDRRIQELRSDVGELRQQVQQNETVR